MIELEEKNYYDVLGISQNATEKEIKHAYRLVSKKYHPDIYKAPDATQKMQAINSAYEVLSDPIKRKRHNEELEQRKQQQEERQRRAEEQRRQEERQRRMEEQRRRANDPVKETPYNYTPPQSGYSASPKYIKPYIIFGILFIATIWITSSIINSSILNSNVNNFAAENPTGVSVVRTLDGYRSNFTGNELQYLVESVKNATPISKATRDIENEKPFVITFFKGSKQFQYELYISMNESDCILKDMKNNKFMLLTTHDAYTLINWYMSDTFYKYSSIPLASITQGDNNTIYPCSGDWYLKKRNGEYHETTVGFPKSSQSTTDNVIMFYNLFNIQFPVQPDKVSVKAEDNQEVVFNGLYSDFFNDYYSDVDKQLKITITAEWYKSANNDYYGTAGYVINVSYEAPKLPEYPDRGTPIF